MHKPKPDEIFYCTNGRFTTDTVVQILIAEYKSSRSYVKVLEVLPSEKRIMNPKIKSEWTVHWDWLIECSVKDDPNLAFLVRKGRVAK